MAIISVEFVLSTTTVTVPSAAQSVVALWAMDMGPNGSVMTSLALSGGASAFTLHVNVPTVAASYERNVGVASATVGSTGTQTITVTPSATPVQGPTVYLVWFDDNITTRVRDTDGVNEQSTTAPSITVDSGSTDIVLGIDAKYNQTLPTTPSGWTSLSGYGYLSQGSKVSQCNVPGASSTTFVGQDANWSAAAAISIAPAGGGASTSLPPIPSLLQRVPALRMR